MMKAGNISCLGLFHRKQREGVEINIEGSQLPAAGKGNYPARRLLIKSALSENLCRFEQDLLKIQAGFLPFGNY